MLKERFTVTAVDVMHFHGVGGSVDFTSPAIYSFSTSTYEEALELGQEQCKTKKWAAFKIDRYYYWEE